MLANSHSQGVRTVQGCGQARDSAVEGKNVAFEGNGAFTGNSVAFEGHSHSREGHDHATCERYGHSCESRTRAPLVSTRYAHDQGGNTI